MKTSGGYKWKFIDDKDFVVEIDISNWKSVSEFPDYQISSQGNVYSSKRNKMMSLYKASYTRIKLFRDGKPHIRYVHVLVAKAYIPQLEGKTLVNHKNGDRYDNRVENLEWCTPQENSQHAVDTGLCPKPKGKKVIQ